MRRPSPNVLPEVAQAVWDTVQSSDGPELVLTACCTLITPMYGGGVTPGKVDCELPIRASALRGQLRFWWRLLNGAGREPAEVFSDESALWGGISGHGPRASQVTVRVAADPVNDPDKRLVAWKNIENSPSYALILNPGDNPELLAARYRFELKLRFKQTVKSEQHAEVIEALRWWASFGGVGARTRRGLGAVKAVSDDVELRPVSADEVEARGGRMVLGQPAGQDAVRAWKDAVDALASFRQGPGAGRNRGSGNRPGRSHWPEPDTIRRLTNRHAPGHDPQHRVDGYYPRAAFGLPLVFHFKDRGDPQDRNGDLVLNPFDHERMASPLILRPWFDGRQFRPAALLLPGWEERVSVPVSLGSRPARPAWPDDPDTRERLAEQIEPMRGRGADVLSAFLACFEAEAGRER